MDAIPNPKNSITTKQPSLLTATQITENCPDKLQELGKRIAVHLEKAAQCDKKADDHRDSAGQYLLQARKACDEGGFDAFREKFCPELGRTRVYEMLAIADGKKSAEEVRASNAKRNKKHRAIKKQSAVRHVTDSKPVQPEPKPERVETNALDQFAYAARHWLPKMSEDDQHRALQLVADLVIHKAEAA